MFSPTLEPDWSEHDARPASVPGWIPSIQSLKAPVPASIINMKANITGSKSTRDKVIEGAFVVTEGIAFLMVIIGLVPGYLPYNLSRLLGFALMVLGAFYFLAAVAVVGARLSFLPSPLKYQDIVGNDGAQTTRLVKNGVYGHCRHPMYFGVLGFCLGWSMVLISVERLFWFAVLYIVLDAKADIEESLLLKGEFAADYEPYVLSKPKFIPGLYLLLTGKTDGDVPLDGEDPSNVSKIAE